MTRVECRQRECANWQWGTCTAEEVIVDQDGICLTQDESDGGVAETVTKVRQQADAGGADDDTDWDDEDWPPDEDEDADTWTDDDWDEDELDARRN